MSISISIIDSEKTIQQNINAAIATYINDTLNKRQNKILNDLKLLIPGWIRKQPEIQSILAGGPGSLIGQFGITLSPTSIVSSIIDSVISTCEIKFIKYSNSLKGGFELSCQPNNLANLLSLPQGHTVYNGGDLHWMDWLLLRGDMIIIANYQYNPQTGIGRSGAGNMVGGGAFRIPPEFAGTDNNNFITRALTGTEQTDQVSKIFATALGS